MIMIAKLNIDNDNNCKTINDKNKYQQLMIGNMIMIAKQLMIMNMLNIQSHLKTDNDCKTEN